MLARSTPRGIRGTRGIYDRFLASLICAGRISARYFFPRNVKGDLHAIGGLDLVGTFCFRAWEFSAVPSYAYGAAFGAFVVVATIIGSGLWAGARSSGSCG
jgi:hypothetical protein